MSSFSGRLSRLGLGGLGERVKSLRRGGRSATADGDGWAAGAADGWAALPPAAAAPHLSTGIVVGSATATTDEETEAVLRELAPGYFDPPSEFDALEHELRQLPVDFTQEQLESVAEDRTAVLEVVSEKLSAHVIANYEQFVAGVDEVEAQLQVAHLSAKRAREALALAQREVAGNLRIAKDTRRKQGLSALLEVLLKLQSANNLQRALKEAQENGEYAEAFWLCAQCTQSMEELGDGLKVAQELATTIGRLYSETTGRLDSALAAIAADFRPSHYSKVLEGYMFLGNVAQLGDEVKAAFIAAIGSSVTKVVRGMLLTKAGYEEKAAAASSLQELLRLLPPELFRTCLARVLMVLFDILVSHFHMVRWHEAALERHATELESLQTAAHQLADHLGGGSSAAAGGSSAAGGVNPSADGAGRPASPDHPLLDGGWGGSGEVHPPVTGRAVMGLQLQRGTASELEEVEARASDESEWGAVLQAVHAGLLGGRRLIWEEAARRIGLLLSTPAAFEGEHFLQVMEWTQRVLAVGEAFAGCPDPGLRQLLERQSAKFFRLYHHSNIEALSSMLDQELWKRLPAPLPSLAEALAARSSSSDEVGGNGSSGSGSAAAGAAAGDYAAFEAFVVRGNPWRKQQSPRRHRQPAALPGLGAAAATSSSALAAAIRQEVDEYGVPRAGSGSLSMPSSAGGSRPGSAQSAGSAGASRSGTEGDELIDMGRESSDAFAYSDGGEAAGGSRGGSGDAQPPAVTASSLRMAKWMRDYAALMRPLRAAAPTIFEGLTELFELYLLHVFVTFGDVSLAELQQAAIAAAHSGHGGAAGQLGGSGQHGGSGGLQDAALTPRLRAALLRIAQDSIGKYRQMFGAHSAAAAAAAVPAAPTAVEVSVLSNAGNLYGLVERLTAAECLLAVGSRLQAARGPLAAALPPGEGAHALETFFSRTVGAAEDLRDFLVGTGKCERVRLLLPLRWVPERLGAIDWVFSEPPTGHGPWVDELGRQLEMFRDRLLQVPSLERAIVCRLWSAAMAHVADACLEGFARCKRASLEGRAGMSLDLQGVGRALQQLLPKEVPLNLRLPDNYVKAFYIPLTELPHWAQTHPEYSPQQVLALTACIAESSQMKKRDKAALLAQIENNLQAMSVGGPGAL
ncbi:hypothetical protein COHA_005265 [Chlorella ohadii]|uniref:Vacuolar protein sorting-associated protein 54 N-terminal domain-containing protein n=1 Tax=Chlorella ohadii TaxID=2649997 RepID=A0AAD5DN16_9CHLO|nr:hypothetical protein COHA_005265 [Chlorella ohadii]